MTKQLLLDSHLQEVTVVTTIQYNFEFKLDCLGSLLVSSRSTNGYKLLFCTCGYHHGVLLLNQQMFLATALYYARDPPRNAFNGLHDELNNQTRRGYVNSVVGFIVIKIWNDWLLFRIPIMSFINSDNYISIVVMK